MKVWPGNGESVEAFNLNQWLNAENCPKLTRMLFVRHAESVDNASRVVSSRPPGSGLTDLGKRQASAVLAQLGDVASAAGIYCSTALRAQETAEIVAQGVNVPVTADPRLLEYDVGELEGGADSQSRRNSFGSFRAWLLKGDLDLRIPGGERGRDVLDRFNSAVHEIAFRHRGEFVIIVSHVGTMTLGLSSLCYNLDISSVWGFSLPHGAMVPVEFDRNLWRCANWPGEPLVYGAVQ